MKTTIEMAREAGIEPVIDPIEGVFFDCYQEELERFAELVRADERARMAQQEPVAWIVEDQSGERLEWASDAHSCHGVPTFPLYTSPPAQPEEDLYDLAVRADNEGQP